MNPFGNFFTLLNSGKMFYLCLATKGSECSGLVALDFPESRIKQRRESL